MTSSDSDLDPNPIERSGVYWSKNDLSDLAPRRTWMSDKLVDEWNKLRQLMFTKLFKSMNLQLIAVKENRRMSTKYWLNHKFSSSILCRMNDSNNFLLPCSWFFSPLVHITDRVMKLYRWFLSQPNSDEMTYRSRASTEEWFENVPQTDLLIGTEGYRISCVVFWVEPESCHYFH